MSLVFFSPIWGSLADNYGRKPMLLRALFGGVLVMLLQGLVTAPWQLLALRTLQGCITGTIAAATILVASVAPQEDVGYALGLLQMAIFLGCSLGPLFGGVIADLFGRRVELLRHIGPAPRCRADRHPVREGQFQASGEPQVDPGEHGSRFPPSLHPRGLCCRSLR